MPIEEFPIDDMPNHAIFHIADLVEVYDRSLAHAINHIYNHLKVLMMVAYANVDTVAAEALVASHPTLKSIAQEMIEGAEGIDQFQAQEEQIVRVLQAELIELIVETVQLAKVVKIKNTPLADKHQADIERLETLIASIPFIDYHYRSDPPPSIVNSHE